MHATIGLLAPYKFIRTMFDLRGHSTLYILVAIHGMCEVHVRLLPARFDVGTHELLVYVGEEDTGTDGRIEHEARRARHVLHLTVHTLDKLAAVGRVSVQITIHTGLTRVVWVL